MKSVLSEFAQYGVDFERLDDFMKEVPPESYLHYKLDDIRTIYEKFEEYLSEKYITKEEMLDVLSDAVPYSDILKGSVVAMDGFTGFTPVQNRLIGELFSVRKSDDHSDDGRKKIRMYMNIRIRFLRSANRWSHLL